MIEACSGLAWPPTSWPLIRRRSVIGRPYVDPLHHGEGFLYVAVNGQLAVDRGKITEARPGRAIRGPGYRLAK